jgi:hypothetical protein
MWNRWKSLKLSWLSVRIGLFIIVPITFAGWLVTSGSAREISSGLNGTSLLGPLLIIADFAPESQNEGSILLVVLLYLILLPIVRLNAYTICASVFGVLLWLFWGMVGSGTNC